MPHRNIRSYRVKELAKTDLDVCTSRQPDMCVYNSNSLPRRVHLGRVINRAHSVDSTLDHSRVDTCADQTVDNSKTGTVRSLRKLFAQKSVDVADVTSAKQQQVRGFVQPPPPATLHLRRVYDDIMNSNATRGGSGRRCVQWAPSTFALVSPVNANHVTLTSSSFSPKPPRHRRVSSPTNK